MKKGLLCGILLSAVLFPVIAQGGDVKESNTFTFKVGKIEVITLVENKRTNDGLPNNLAGIDPATLAKFFTDSPWVHETNAFLIRDGKKITLIDTGFGTTLFDNLKALGVSPNDVSAVLITHMHGDHIGGLAKDGAALFPKATIYLDQVEYDYWTKTEANAGAIAALAPYGKNVKTFKADNLNTKAKAVVSGITPFAGPGHTPGHTLFMVESGKDKLLVVGDILHVERVQFALPNISATYDRNDPEGSVITRKSVLSYAATNKIPIAGMHFLYPAIGTVTVDGDSFKWNPAK